MNCLSSNRLPGVPVSRGAKPRQHHLDGQAALLQVKLVVAVGFQLGSGAGFNSFGGFHHLVVVEVQARDGKVALWVGGFFFDVGGFARLVKRHNAIVLRIGDVVRKHCGITVLRIGIDQQRVQIVPVEGVVAQH